MENQAYQPHWAVENQAYQLHWRVENQISATLASRIFSLLLSLIVLNLTDKFVSLLSQNLNFEKVTVIFLNMESL